MINYTERIALLMDDVCRRTPRLSFIDLKEVLIFGRFGRSHTRGSVRHVPLPDASRERAGLLLLARPRYRSADSPIRVVHHQVARRQHRRHQDQVSDLVRAAALLRSVARSIAQGRSLSRGRAGLARQARHRHPRALSHRSGSGGYPQTDPRRRQRLAALARARVLRGSGRDGAGLLSSGSPTRSSTTSSSTTSPTLTSRFGGVVVDHVPEFSVVSAALHAGGRDADRSERSGSSASSLRRSPCSIRPTTSRCGSSSTRRRRRLTRKGAHQAA